MPEDTCWPWSSVPFQLTSWVPAAVISRCFKVRTRRPSIEKMRSVTGPVLFTVYEIAVSGLNGFGEADVKIGAALPLIWNITLFTPRSGAAPDGVWTCPVMTMFTLLLFGVPLKRSLTHDVAK